MTLCVIRSEDKVLLAMKKRGFGKGNWNGYGGKLLESETIEEALVRELNEESTIQLTEYEKRGEVVFHFPDMIRHVYIYEGIKWEGEAEETEEMSPQWFHINEIPFDSMWPDDKYWFPFFLQKTLFNGKVLFDENQNIIEIDIKPL